MHLRRLLKALLLLPLKKPRPRLPKQRSLLVKNLPRLLRPRLKSLPTALLLLRKVLPQPLLFLALILLPRIVVVPVCRRLVARNSGPS